VRHGEAEVGRSAAETLRAYLSGQRAGVDDALGFVAADAVFDVGRGRYEGTPEIRAFVERLLAVHSVTSVVELRAVSDQEAVALLEQRDDDLGPLGIDSIRLDVRVETTDDGLIKTFTARPTPESMAALSAARNAGRSSEGLDLAERAGTLPPHPPG
jgi:hypothetical protein